MTTVKIYNQPGTNKPLNMTMSVFFRVYLQISAAGQGRECHKFPGSPVDAITAAGSPTAVTQSLITKTYLSFLYQIQQE